MAVSNTKALELLGIDENTRVYRGTIVLDTNGIPNGIFDENATRLTLSVIPKKNNEDIEREFLTAAEYALSVGITSVQSADVGGKSPRNMFNIIHNIYDNKKTKLRYSTQFNFQDIDSLGTILK